MGRYTGKRCRLLSMFGLTGSFFLVEIVVGYVTNSMALVADSFHMLSDIAALIIAFISVKMAPKSWTKVSEWESDGNCQHFNIVVLLYAVMVLSLWGHLHMMFALEGVRGVLKNQTK